MTTEELNALIEVIKQVAGSECQRVMKSANVASNHFATILSRNENKTYNVLLVGGDTPYTNLVNKTGETLEVGDIVLIEALNGNIGNGYIKLKQGVSDISGAPDTIAWGKVYDTPTTLNGYGIQDAKIEGGTITLGQNSLTPITVEEAPVQSVNNKTGNVVLSASDVGALPDTTTIPTKTSQLTNDSNFVSDDSYVHTDNNFTDVLKTQIGTNQANIARHIADNSNPHSVTKEQIGLANVDNVKQWSASNHPTTLSGYGISDAVTSAEFDSLSADVEANATSIANHIADQSNPHEVTKTQIGLGNVDNVKQYSASNPPPYPVTSVNSKTGAVSLTASDVSAVAKSGDTMTGSLTTPALLTGTAEANYFQSKKFRGEGNANTYYHAIDFGYSGHNQVDFHEYGGLWNFYQNTVGTSGGGTLVASIQRDGFHGNLTGTATMAKSVYPATTTTVGGIKVGSGLAITSDGTLSATGGGIADSVDWSNVENKPTTIAGYGITDAVTSVNGYEGEVELDATDVNAVPISGGTMTGTLTVGNATIQTNGYVSGTRLRTTANAHLDSTATNIAVLSDGWVYSRTASEIKSDIGAGNTQSYKITGKTVTTSAWTTNTNSQASSTEKSDYPYMATISITSPAVTIDDIARVMFSYDDQASDNFAINCYTITNGVIIEAKEKPSATITLDYILIEQIL